MMDFLPRRCCKDEAEQEYDKLIKGGVGELGAVKILALPKRGGSLTYAKIFLVDL